VCLYNTISNKELTFVVVKKKLTFVLGIEVVLSPYNRRHITHYFIELAMFSSQKNLRFSVTSNVWTHAWSIKCRRKKLITQFGRKPRNESFELN
jgi:hypothetical protein